MAHSPESHLIDTIYQPDDQLHDTGRERFGVIEEDGSYLQGCNSVGWAAGARTRRNPLLAKTIKRCHPKSTALSTQISRIPHLPASAQHH